MSMKLHAGGPATHDNEKHTEPFALRAYLVDQDRISITGAGDERVNGTYYTDAGNVSGMLQQTVGWGWMKEGSEYGVLQTAYYHEYYTGRIAIAVKIGTGMAFYVYMTPVLGEPYTYTVPFTLSPPWTGGTTPYPTIDLWHGSVLEHIDRHLSVGVHISKTSNRTTSGSLNSADAMRTITMNSTLARVLTVPLNSSIAFVVGTTIPIVRRGAGTVTITGAAGVTINGAVAGSVAISAQYQSVSLLKVGTDEWIASGAIA